MDFERDWNGKSDEALHPHAEALAPRGKATHPGRHPDPMHHAAIVKTVAPDAQGVVVLPAGTDINQIEVSGRNLIVHLPDGTDMVILDGAVVMPRLVVGDVEITAVNLAALLIGEEPQPAAGPARSSGGNFIGPDGDVGDPHGLGDLLPPTELQFTQSEEQEILPFPLADDERPEVIIITPDQPAGAIAATAGVSEAGLPARGSEPAGSAAATDSEKTSGTISIVANDGLAGVTINGTAITTVGQTIATPLGVLTITSLSGSAIGYSYVLSDNVVGTPPAEIFTVVVTDADGDQATATLTITIADDAPTAVNDADSVTEDGPLVADGNVLTGVGGGDANATDGVADVQGADGAVVSTTGIFQGTYGTLTIDASGAYSYVLANGNAAVQFLTPGQTLTDSFSYTIRDADGDTSTATLTITINGADDGVSITGLNGAPGVEGAEVVVQENDLPDGSSPNAAALTQTGSFGVSGADGLSTVTVGGVTVLSNGAFVAGQVVTTPLGTLTLTGFTATSSQGGVPTAGTFTYSFVLTDNSLAHEAAGADSIFQNFAVAVTDRNGSTASGSIDVQIVDDVPTAVNDAAQTVAENGDDIGGNVLTNDIAGADGATLTSVTIGGVTTAIAAVGATSVTTAYGVYSFTATGAWTFNPSNGLNNANGVDAGFSYTITDGDGDQSSANQPITVTDGAGPTAGAPISLLLDDQNLATGSTPANPDFDSKSISFTPGSDAIVSIVFGNTSGLSAGLNWERLSGTKITGSDANGVVVTLDLSVVGTIATVTATLNHAYAMHPGVNIDDLVALGSVQVIAQDADGDSASATVSIGVSDDVPLAADDTDVVKEDVALVASGNVLTGVGSDGNAAGADSLGADGPAVGGAVTAVSGGTVGGNAAGAYGTLVLNASGGYTYTLNNGLAAVQHLGEGQTLTDSFTYTITDRDGDSSTATLTITINGTDDAPQVGSGVAIVSEEGLPGANADMVGSPSDTTNSATASGTISATDPDGNALSMTLGDPGAVLTSHGVAVTWAGVGTQLLTGSAGGVPVITISITDGGAYTVTLLQSVDHSGINVEDLKIFTVPVTVSDGTSSVDTSIAVTIEDDSPIAVDDSITTREKAPASTGNVLTNDHVGADAPGAVVSINGQAIAAGGSQTIVGLYGTLQIFSDGSYSYTPKISVASGLSESFTYTMRDADNDTASATLKFTFAGDANRPTADNVSSKVDDDGLPGGNPLSTLGDVNTNVGDLSGLNSSEASYSGKLSFGFGPDGAGSLSFANLNGTTGTVGTETVSYSWNAGTSTLLATVNAGARAGMTLFQVVLNTNTGAYTVTLLHNVLHAAGGNEADAPQVDLAFLVTDSDYDAITNPGSSATGRLRIVFNDDMPSAFTPTSGSVVNNDSAPAQFALNFAAVAGADGVGGALFTIANGTLAKDSSGNTLRLNGEELYLYGSGTNVLTAQTASGAVGYTVTLLPGTDRYEVDLHGTITNGSEISISSFSDVHAGNVDFRGLGVGTSDAIDILMSGRAAGGGQATVNTSSTSIGIGNQSVDAGEALRIDFVKTLTTDVGQSTGFSYSGHQGVMSFEQAIAQTNGGGSGQRSVRITAIDADDDQIFGSSSTTPEAGESFVAIVRVVVTDASTGLHYSFTGNGTQGAFTVTFSAGHVTISGLEVNDRYEVSTATPFDAVLVESPTGNGSLDLGLFSVVTANTGTPITISHPIIASDGDGDSVASTVGVTLTPASAPPVAIDLDGDGLEFVGLGAGVTHDYGQGEVATAWVSRDDGLLAHAVGGGYDIVFADDASGAKSDLDGLRLAYDGNGDGLFDAKDAAFAEFSVWQDANANGRVDAGEYKTLTEAGIVAINLTADGKSYSAANGDVTVLGEGSFVRADGSTGTIGDVQFATGAKAVDAAKADSTTGFNQALVAASLVAVAGVAEAATEQHSAPVATESTAPAAESLPAPTSTVEPTATQDGAPIFTPHADDQPEHDQPVAQTSHGDEEAVPDHASLSGGSDHAAPADMAQADPAPVDHQDLLAQSIALPPSFDGNAAALLAAQQDAPKVTAAEVVKEALGAHDAPHIDALLAALPGGDHPTAPVQLAPMADQPVVDSGHMAAMAAIFEAAQVAHEAIAHG